jgi:hypothetical protein
MNPLLLHTVSVKLRLDIFLTSISKPLNYFIHSGFPIKIVFAFLVSFSFFHDPNNILWRVQTKTALLSKVLSYYLIPISCTKFKLSLILFRHRTCRLFCSSLFYNCAWNIRDWDIYKYIPYYFEYMTPSNLIRPVFVCGF